MTGLEAALHDGRAGLSGAGRLSCNSPGAVAGTACYTVRSVLVGSGRPLDGPGHLLPAPPAAPAARTRPWTDLIP
ncbi:hypothetical protein GCM10010430_16700 [Kitasatospora cystarginea]|uniref:Uncharacterized protein n=1 Tax=Kitasatospora cystarginea TaxID=58350 RepID=A0ABN3DMF3_9ACTN